MTQPKMAVAQPDETRAEATGAETIEELFAALESPLLAYALRLVREQAVAEDLVQDAFLKLHAGFHEVRAPRRWLFRTVHNLALNHQRRAAKVIPLDFPPEGAATAAELTDPQALPDEQIVRWERIGQVRLSLETLDARSRELIRLKFTENLSYEQISARTGLKAGYVGSLLHHAINAIAA